MTIVFGAARQQRLAMYHAPFLTPKFIKLPECSASKDNHMRLSILVFTAVAAVLFPVGSEAGTVRDPGAGFLKHKHPKLQKDYFVVHKGEGDKCSIVIGSWGDAPAGALGGAPYASKEYASAALKKFPECKAGEVEGGSDDKKPGKK
jgi:hypothetical protein